MSRKEKRQPKHKLSRKERKRLKHKLSRKERKRLKHSSEPSKKQFIFSSEVKEEIRQRYDNRCAISGKKTRLEVHHKCWKGWARDAGVASYIIRSIANAIPLSHEEHVKIHSIVHNKEYFLKTLEQLKRDYIGGYIFLLEYPSVMFDVVYDQVFGESRRV